MPHQKAAQHNALGDASGHIYGAVFRKLGLGCASAWAGLMVPTSVHAPEVMQLSPPFVPLITINPLTHHIYIETFQRDAPPSLQRPLFARSNEPSCIDLGIQASSVCGLAGSFYQQTRIIQGCALNTLQ